MSRNRRLLFVVSNGLFALGGVAAIVAILTASRIAIIVAACLAAATGLTSLGLATRRRPGLFTVMSLAFSGGLVVAGASIVVALASGSRPVGLVTAVSAIVAGIGLCGRSAMDLIRREAQPG